MAAKTARKKKGSSSRGSSTKTKKRSTASGRSANTRSTRSKAVSSRKRKNEGYSEAVADDIIVILVLMVSIVLLLCCLGFSGRFGRKISYGMFGMLGYLAYIFPFFLLLGTAFMLSNRGSRLAKIKFTASIFFFWSIAALIAVTRLGNEPISGYIDGFKLCAGTHRGPGLFGYLPAYPLYGVLGRVASTVVFICTLLISTVLVTGRRIFVRLWHLIAMGAGSLSSKLDGAMEARRERMEAQESEDDEAPFDYDEIDEDRKKKPQKPAKKRKDPEDIVINIPASQRVRKIDADSPVKTPASYSSPERKRPERSEIKVPEFLNGGSIKPSEKSFARDYEPPERDEYITEQEDANPVTVKTMGGDAWSRIISSAGVDRDTDKETDDHIEKQTEKQTERAEETDKPSDKPADSGEEIPEISLEETKKEYIFPPYDLLEKGSGSSSFSSEDLRKTAVKLQETFDSFGVGVTVTNVSCGPTVTRYELQPDTGVKVSRILSLSDDIKLNLAVSDIRIEAPISGKAAVGIEVPNESKQTIHLRDVLESETAASSRSKLAFTVGKDIGGMTVMGNIEKMPHLLVAGATGSGKSVCINTIIMNILYRSTPEEVRLIMIDPKVVELTVYNGLPHLLIPVVTDPKKAAGALNWAVQTMMERYDTFSKLGVRNISAYNEKVSNGQQEAGEGEIFKKMPQILIIIDELADLMMVAKADVENAIIRLSQLARAAGIHLVVATQRPTVDVLTGTIKTNLPSRIAFAVSSATDSRVILDMSGAEKLLGNGDMLFYPQGYPKPVRVQGAFVSDREIAAVVDHIKQQYEEPVTYDEDITKDIDRSSASIGSGYAADSTEGDRDSYFEEAGRFIIEKDKASIGMLQRVFKIGFNRAARIMDQLADAGVVGPEIGTKPRKILMTMDEFEHYLANN